MGGKVGENPAALPAAVISLSSKKLRGGGVQTLPPPSRAQVNRRATGLQEGQAELRCEVRLRRLRIHGA